MRILAIETSCDETGAAVLEKDEKGLIKVLSNVTATSSSLHAKTGGIIPENAAREQVKFMIPVIAAALLKSQEKENNLTMKQFNNLFLKGNSLWIDPELFKKANTILKNTIDAIAVTQGPGLIGSLLVGVETAKTLSFALNKPIVPVHHLLAHLYANFIELNAKPYPLSPFPFIGLIVSGGHTDILCFRSHSNYKWLGGTRDDAAGEAFDKIGRILGFAYPSGPEIEKRAKTVGETSIKFHSPLINSEDFDFSFSGLKTEAMRFIKDRHLTKRLINEICRAVEDSITAVLIKKTIRSAKLYKISTILLGGGVSANEALRKELELRIMNQELGIKVFAPSKSFATDNAAMIGAYALLNYKPAPWNKVSAQPELYFD